MAPGDRVEVRCFTRGSAAKWKPGTVVGEPTTGEWLVQLDDGGHVHPIQIVGMRPLGIPVEAQPDSVHGVGSFWGGLAKLANPLSSPLSPIAQARRTMGAFRGGGGRSAPPPSYGPPPFDPSQQYAGPPPFDPSQAYGPPASQMYASPTNAPGGDWSQYSTPGSGWDAFGGGPTNY